MVHVVAPLFKKEHPNGTSEVIEHGHTRQDGTETSTDGQEQDGGPKAGLEEWLGSVGKPELKRALTRIPA